MEQTPKDKARRQLIVSLVILAVAVGGYLVTRQLRGTEEVARTQEANVAGERVTREGFYVCLTHKEADQAQSGNCALGLRDDEGSSYALELSGDDDAPLDSRIRVEGVLRQESEQTMSLGKRYEISGVIAVDSFEQL